MDIGIGLPNAVRGVDRRGIVDWASRAEQAGFSSLGTIDRIAYPNYEALISLAAAAAVTERIRLVTDILISPLRSNTALFAKQSATIDSLSDGRLVLGLAVGGRGDDYELSGVDFHRRGAIFDRQLRELTDLWAGEDVGPDPADGKRPALLIGGSSEQAHRRAAEYADGWTMGGGTPDDFSDALAKLRSAWSEAGRCSTSPSATMPSRWRSRAWATITPSSVTTRSRSFNRQPRTRTPSRATSRRSSKRELTR